MRQKQIPISLLTGYLGAGKTSLLNHVLQNQKGYRVAVVVNDIGEINVDASLIADKGFVREADENLIPLQNGCICCTLKQDLIKQMLKLALSGRFDAILIEASGICEPIPIAQSLTPSPNASAAQEDLLELCYLDSITAVVDAKRMADEFDNGDALTRPGIEEDDIENLLVQQIEFCNTVVLNKVDLVTTEQKQRIRAMILALQPGAHIIEANYGAVDCKEILFTHAFSFAKAITSTGWQTRSRMRASRKRTSTASAPLFTGKNAGLIRKSSTIMCSVGSLQASSAARARSGSPTNRIPPISLNRRANRSPPFPTAAGLPLRRKGSRLRRCERIPRCARPGTRPTVTAAPSWLLSGRTWTGSRSRPRSTHVLRRSGNRFLPTQETRKSYLIYGTRKRTVHM